MRRSRCSFAFSACSVAMSASVPGRVTAPPQSMLSNAINPPLQTRARQRS